jgi:ribosomal-protein-alanine N-acetyltransferase
MKTKQSEITGVPFALREGRVTLRPFGRKELMSKQYLSWMNDADVTRTIGRFDYLFPVSRAKLIKYFEGIDTESEIFLAITADGPDRTSEFVGTLKVYDIDYLARRASLGILIGDKAQWGRGIASIVIRVACRYIFQELGFDKVAAGYLASNKAMQRAFEKNGFVVEGVLKGHLFFRGQLVDHVLVGKFKESAS